MADAKWLAHVGLLGCFSWSFIPCEVYLELRSTARYLTPYLLKKSVSIKVWRMPVLCCPAFLRTFGMSMQEKYIEAILNGKTAEEIFSVLDLRSLKASEEDIRDALEGELSEFARFTILEIKDHIKCLRRENFQD